MYSIADSKFSSSSAGTMMSDPILLLRFGIYPLMRISVPRSRFASSVQYLMRARVSRAFSTVGPNWRWTAARLLGLRNPSPVCVACRVLKFRAVLCTIWCCWQFVLIRMIFGTVLGRHGDSFELWICWMLFTAFIRWLRTTLTAIVPLVCLIYAPPFWYCD